MKVICIDNNIKKINDESCFIFPDKPVEYNFVVGKEYLVMGILMYYEANLMCYLIDHGSRPSWISYAAFQVSDSTIFSDWSFSILLEEEPSENPYAHMIGFKELSESGYFDALLEGDSRALEIYEIRKREKLEWYQ